MKKIKKYIGSAITIISSVWFLFTLLHIILTGKIPLWNLPSCIPTFFFIIIPLFLLICVFLFSKKLLNVLILVLALIFGLSQVDINLFKVKSIEVQQNEYLPIRVFNWNTSYWDQNKSKKHFCEFLKRQKADIYILQEYLHLKGSNIEATKENIEQFKLFSICPAIPGFEPIYQPVNDIQEIKKEFPDYYVESGNQFIIISKFPIKTFHVDYSGQYAVSDIDIQGRLVRFFDVHILLHIEPESIFKSNFYDTLSRRFKGRQLGIENLKRDIKKNKGEYFISGDFNTSKAMGVMNDLLEDNIDAIKYSDEFIPFTFEFKGIRLWRLDYALIPKDSNNILIKSCKIINHEGLSDHNPLSLVLYLKNSIPLPK